MKKFVPLAALALAATAGMANAQNFRLDLTLTARTMGNGTDINGDPTTVFTDVAGSTQGTVTTTPGQTYIIELRYRIADLVADTTGSTGLTAAQILISRNLLSGTVARSVLSNWQTSNQDINGDPITAPSKGFFDPDNSGPGSGNTGLIKPFRGGLSSDSDASNGIPDPSSNPLTFQIVPLTLSSPAQNSWRPGANPTVSNTNGSTAVWALYDFLYTTGSSNVTFTAGAIADPDTGNAFAYFERNGTVDNPSPANSLASTNGTINFVVPAPASVALLGLGGLVAARRRRA